MIKKFKINMVVSLTINLFILLFLFFTKEELDIIKYMLLVISPILLSMTLCYIINKGTTIQKKDKLKLNIIYFIPNLIFYICIYFLLKDGEIINHIISKTTTLQSEYITVSKNSNFLSSLVIFFALSFFGHKLIIDRIKEK